MTLDLPKHEKANIVAYDISCSEMCLNITNDACNDVSLILVRAENFG